MDLQARGRAVGDSIADLAAWAIEEVRRDLPPSILRLGRRAIANRYDLTPGGGLKPAGQVLRSWIGALSWTNEGAAARGSRADRIELALPDAAILRFRVDVNPVIARRGNVALRSRLQQHSPVPADRSVLAWSLVGPGPDGRILVDVAIAYRTAVDQAISLAREQGNRWRIVASREDGPPLVFADSDTDTERPVWRNTVVRTLIIVTAALICMSAISDRFGREAGSIAAQRDLLLEEASSLRMQHAAQVDVEPALLVARSYARLPDLLDGLAEVFSDSDGPAAIARLDLQSPDAVRVLPTESGSASVLIALSVPPIEDSES
ncbi:MAG: hypothetical protein CMF73_11425 [Maricaulis sp.]|nr:hypothetical protein [Maricaulis sp.]